MFPVQLDKTPQKILKNKIKKQVSPIRRYPTIVLSELKNNYEPKAVYYAAAPVNDRLDENKRADSA